ncbi:UNVERIFIED_CONTAM: hypothetical protein K2H54_009372, partial [Gekko kuhli]
AVNKSPKVYCKKKRDGPEPPTSSPQPCDIIHPGRSGHFLEAVSIKGLRNLKTEHPCSMAVHLRLPNTREERAGRDNLHLVPFVSSLEAFGVPGFRKQDIGLDCPIRQGSDQEGLIKDEVHSWMTGTAPPINHDR